MELHDHHSRNVFIWTGRLLLWWCHIPHLAAKRAPPGSDLLDLHCHAPSHGGRLGLLPTLFLALQQLSPELGQIDFTSERDQELTQLELGHSHFEVPFNQRIHFFIIHRFHSHQQWQWGIELLWLPW